MRISTSNWRVYKTCARRRPVLSLTRPHVKVVVQPLHTKRVPDGYNRCTHQAHVMRLSFMSASTQTFHVDGQPPTLWRTNCCGYNGILTYGSMCTVICVSKFFFALCIYWWIQLSRCLINKKEDAQMLSYCRESALHGAFWLEQANNILRTYRSIFNHCGINRPAKLSNSLKTQNKNTPFKVIQGNRGRYQPKALATSY